VIGEVAGVLSGGGTFILDEKFTSPGIFPRGGTFSFYIYPIFPTHSWQPFLLSNIAAEYFPEQVKFSLYISLNFPTFTSSQLATVLTFKYSGRIFPRGGKFRRENFPAGGRFSLRTVGNTFKFTYGALGKGVT